MNFRQEAEGIDANLKSIDHTIKSDPGFAHRTSRIAYIETALQSAYERGKKDGKAEGMEEGKE